MKPLRCFALQASVAAMLLLILVAPPELFAQKGEMSITTSSKEAMNLFMQGRDKAENIEQAAAAALFEQAIQKDPNFALAYLYRAQSGGGFNISRQSLDKAISLADKASPGERHWILYAQAQSDGDTAKAKESLDQLLKLFPADKRVHYLAGNYHRLIGDDRMALQEFTKVVERDKKFAPAYNLLGYAQSALGNYKAAEEAFKTYIKLLPNSPNPYDSYAELLLKTGKYDESIAQYRKALAIDPAFSGSLTGIGNNYLFKGDYAKARESYQQLFDKARAVNVKVGAMNSIITSYVHEGKTEEALKAVEQLRAFAETADARPAIIATYNNAGFILAESGKVDEAMKQFEMANKLREESSLPPAFKENGRFGAAIAQARASIARREFDAAKAKIEEARGLAAAKKNPFQEKAVNEALGHLELEQKNYDKALQHFAMADTEDPYVWYHTALAYEQKGDTANAAKLYAKVVNWNQNDFGYAFVRPQAMKKMNGMAKMSK